MISSSSLSLSQTRGNTISDFSRQAEFSLKLSADELLGISARQHDEVPYRFVWLTDEVW